MDTNDSSDVRCCIYQINSKQTVNRKTELMVDPICIVYKLTKTVNRKTESAFSLIPALCCSASQAVNNWMLMVAVDLICIVYK